MIRARKFLKIDTGSSVFAPAHDGEDSLAPVMSRVSTKSLSDDDDVEKDEDEEVVDDSFDFGNISGNRSEDVSCGQRWWLTALLKSYRNHTH